MTRRDDGERARLTAARPDDVLGGLPVAPPPPAVDPATASPRDAAADRRRRRAVFLRDLAEARELRARVHPRRTRAARMRQALRMRSFRA